MRPLILVILFNCLAICPPKLEAADSKNHTANVKRLSQQDEMEAIECAQNYVRGEISRDREVMLAFVDPKVLAASGEKLGVSRAIAEKRAMALVPKIYSTAFTNEDGSWNQKAIHVRLEARKGTDSPLKDTVYNLYMIRRDNRWYVGFGYPSSFLSQFVKRLTE